MGDAGPGGADGAPPHGRDRAPWESRALLARRAQTGRRRNTGARAHGHMDSRWSRPPLRKQHGKHTHRPGALNAKSSSLRLSRGVCPLRLETG